MSLPTATGSGGSRDALRVGANLVWSSAVWVALWGDLSVANVLWGAVLGTVTMVSVPVVHKAHRLPVRVLPMIRFGLVVAWSLVKASAIVAWEVVTPVNDINEGIVAIPLRTTSPGLMTLLANVISLTPGTLTLETRRSPPTVYVHVLHLRHIEDVRQDIHHLEDLVMVAFAERAPDGTELEQERP